MVEVDLLDLAAVAYRVLEASANRELVELALEVDLELEVNCWLSCPFFADPSAHLIPRGR
tara:strand:+ start:95 stop:274 length:180 start_codon:yes stop_codon:yes gene_type:complete